VFKQNKNKNFPTRPLILAAIPFCCLVTTDKDLKVVVFRTRNLTVDSQGNIYVFSSFALPAIEKLDSTDQYITKWGDLGSGDVQIGHFGPMGDLIWQRGQPGIATDSQNNVYVVDAPNNRIERFDKDGGLLALYQPFPSRVNPFPVWVWLLVASPALIVSFVKGGLKQ
jgi:hypothetical protein